jgi:hypothetical protein
MFIPPVNNAHELGHVSGLVDRTPARRVKYVPPVNNAHQLGHVSGLVDRTPARRVKYVMSSIAD